MADHYSVIGRAASRLPSQTDEARQAIYERAGTALRKRLKAEITQFDVALIVCVSLTIPFLELAKAGSYLDRLENWGDNRNYVEIANVIRSGGIPTSHHFWGFPDVMATIQAAFGVPGFAAIALISVVCSVAAAFLMDRLYGATVTIAFLILIPKWTQLAVMGPSEPLFVCLLLGSWLAFRSKGAILAVVLASFATTVRPVGFFALCGIGFALILQRDWKRLAMSVCIAAGIGLAYLAQCRVISGDPLINFRLYSAYGWPSGNPLSLPFVQLGESTLFDLLNTRWTYWIDSLFSIALVAFGALRLLRKFPTLVRSYPADTIFVICYLSFLACFHLERNSYELMPIFSRYLIPVIPFVLFVARDWLPKNRFVLWPLAVFSALIASSPLVGFETVFGFSLH